MENQLKENQDKLIKQLLSNAKDAKWAEQLIRDILSLQRQLDVEAVELAVPTKEVKATFDGGAYVVSKTIRGILFAAKGGMSTFVDMRMSSLYKKLDLVYFGEGVYETPDDEGRWRGAVATIMQAFIFASLSDKVLFDIAAFIIKSFREDIEQRFEAPAHEETQEDIEANIVYENAAEALNILAEAPIPNTDEE